ncbi:hypothetical protein [Solicola sp. PLA-1-18]|uniref:hypothetical protein n=1 Tax=Solicola sp. PLA-1-18 TaxID=3380532 RepID=UPI003B77B038
MSTTTSHRPVASRPAVPGGLAAAVLGATALAASNVCFAILTADGAARDTADYLRLVQGRPLLVEVGAALGLLACLFLVPAVWAVVGRIDEGRARLASVGGWLMSSGYVMGVALSVETLLALSVSASDLSPAGFVDAVDHRTTAVATGMYAVFGIGALLGGLVLGVAMLRDRDVPRWCGVALVASEPVRVAGLLSGVHGLTAVASLLILTSFVAVLRPRP